MSSASQANKNQVFIYFYTVASLLRNLEMVGRESPVNTSLFMGVCWQEGMDRMVGKTDMCTSNKLACLSASTMF